MQHRDNICAQSGPLDLRAGLKYAHEALERICAHNTRHYREADARSSSKPTAQQCHQGAPNSLPNSPPEQGLRRFANLTHGTAAATVPAVTPGGASLPSSDDGEYGPMCKLLGTNNHHTDEHRRPAPASEPLTYFHSRLVSRLSLWRLSAALVGHTRCELDSTAVALVLFMRYCETASMRPTLHMMHRLYVACFQVGLKAHSDSFLKNSAYSRVAGITLVEMNRLENTLVDALGWQVQVRCCQGISVVSQLCAPFTVDMWGEHAHGDPHHLSSITAAAVQDVSAAVVVSPTLVDAITAKPKPEFRLCTEVLNASLKAGGLQNTASDDFELPTDETSPQCDDEPVSCCAT